MKQRGRNGKRTKERTWPDKAGKHKRARERKRGGRRRGGEEGEWEREHEREEFPRRPQNSITPCLQLSTLNPLYWIQSVCRYGVSQNLINFMGKGFGWYLRTRHLSISVLHRNYVGSQANVNNFQMRLLSLRIGFRCVLERTRCYR